MKTLFVAGNFEGEGRPSKIANIIREGINLQDADCVNGGTFHDLEHIMDNIKQYKLIYWFANVPNTQPKLIKSIKEQNNACVLVTSKRNVEGKYSFQDLIYHALGNKSNVVVEFTKPGTSYQGRVFDPLGNVFLDHNEDFTLVGKVLAKRANELANQTRVGSTRIADSIPTPNEAAFFEIIREYANALHHLIHVHPDAANRFLGNASFRCERGFPSFAYDDLLFVSRRNIDKRYVDQDSFVAVKRELPVLYYGNDKPSVDTPVQILLYQHYPQARYMLHTHAYVKDAPFTGKLLPCGAIEEAQEIVRAIPEGSINFKVNIKGHGSLVVADDVSFLKDVPFTARSMPEVHDEYAMHI